MHDNVVNLRRNTRRRTQIIALTAPNITRYGAVMRRNRGVPDVALHHAFCPNMACFSAMRTCDTRLQDIALTTLTP